jgi:hypothetical protein
MSSSTANYDNGWQNDMLINGNADWQSAAAFMLDQDFERDALSIRIAPQLFATGRPQYIVGVHKRTDDLAVRLQGTVPVAATFSGPAREEYVAIEFRDDVGCVRLFIRRVSIASQARTSERDRALVGATDFSKFTSLD